MTRLGRQIRTTESKNKILQSLNYRGGCALPTSWCQDFYSSSEVDYRRIVSFSFCQGHSIGRSFLFVCISVCLS